MGKLGMIFRRFHGRIVPIRVAKDKSKALTRGKRVIYGDRTNVKSSTVRGGEYKNAAEMITDLFKKKKR